MHTRLGIWFLQRFVVILALSIAIVIAVILAERALPAPDGCLAISDGNAGGLFDLTTARWSSPALAEAARANAQYDYSYALPSKSSPDGKYVAYLKRFGTPANYRIALVVRPTGSGILPQRETIIRAPLPEPSIVVASYDTGLVDFLWLPDSSGIIYRWRCWFGSAENEDGANHECAAVAGADGAEKVFRHLALPAATYLSFGGLSADGRYVALIGISSGIYLDLWSVSDLQPVTAPILLYPGASRAVWSPRGNWVAYWVPDTTPESALVLHHVEKNERVVFPDLNESASSFWLDWSPDGNYVNEVLGNGTDNVTPHILGIDGAVHAVIPAVQMAPNNGGYSAPPPLTMWLQKPGAHTLVYVQPVPHAAVSTFDLTTFDPETQETRTLLTGLDEPPDTRMYYTQPEGHYLFIRWIKDGTAYAGIIDTRSGDKVILNTARAIPETRQQVLALGWSPAGYAVAMSATSIVWMRPNGTQRCEIPFDERADIFQDLYSDAFTPNGLWLILNVEPVDAINLVTGEYRRRIFDTVRPISGDEPFTINQLPDTILRWLWDKQNSSLILQSTDLNSGESHSTTFATGMLGNMYDLNWARSPDGSRLAFVAPERTGRRSILTVITNRGEVVRQYAPFIQSYLTWAACN